MSHRRFRAFTLIELLVVIAIIGILVVLAMTSYTRARMNARDGKRKTDVAAYVAGFEKYRLTKGTYFVSDATGRKAGVGGNSWGRLNYVGGADSLNYSPSDTTLALLMKDAGLIDAIAKDPSSATKADTVGNIRDYIAIRCDSTGAQVTTATVDDSVAVWAKLENVPSEVQIENAQSVCGGSKGKNGGVASASSFGSQFMRAPSSTNTERDNQYFALGTTRK